MPNGKKTESEKENTVVLEYSEQFGKQLFHPANELAKKLAKFRGRKNFVKSEVEFLKSVGFDIRVKVKEFKVPEGII